MNNRFYFTIVGVLLCKFFCDATAQPNDIARAIEQQRREKDRAFQSSSDSPLPDKAKKNFHGLPYFPINPKFRFEGSITRYNKRETFDIIASDGRERKTLRYGYFDFSLDGKIHRLQVYRLLDLDPQYSHLLFIPFLDATSGRESYAGGRYLDLEERKGNHYLIDFNLAYNPSCAYGKKGYSCPIPPAENRLPIRIEAGEKRWEH
jgi:hypothetical protein